MDKNTKEYFLRHTDIFPDNTNIPEIYYKARKQNKRIFILLILFSLSSMVLLNKLYNLNIVGEFILFKILGFLILLYPIYKYFIKNIADKLKKKTLILDKIICFIKYRHFVIEFTHCSSKERIGNNKEILHYLLFDLYKNKDTSGDLEDSIENYLKFINDKYAYTEKHSHDEDYKYTKTQTYRYSIEEFNKNLKRNPDYQKETIRQNIERILTEIRDYEYKLKEKRADTYIEQRVNSKKIQNLITNTNVIYRTELYDTVIIMNRKIIENLLIQLYQKHGQRLAWYDKEYNRQKTLGALKNQFKKDMPEIEVITGVDFNDNFIGQIENIQNKGNKYVHNANHLDLESDIEELESDINNVILVLNKIDEQLEVVDEKISYKKE